MEEKSEKYFENLLAIDKRLCNGALPNCAGVGARMKGFSSTVSLIFVTNTDVCKPLAFGDCNWKTKVNKKSEALRILKEFQEINKTLNFIPDEDIYL